MIACAVCLHAVTTAAERAERAGRHAHTFANPHGFVFHVACFTSAPGCRTAGDPSAAFSWFPGYAWQVAECRGCGEHLGWLFRSEAGRFHALITSRLAEAGERT